MSPEELERYARHIVLREIGGAGQRRLGEARVLVVGAGGLGSPVILYLAAAGIGRIVVVDDDSVALSNLQRQVLHNVTQIGHPKVESARSAVAELNPYVAVEAHQLRLAEENASGFVAGADVVLDGSDSFRTREIVNVACVELGVPLVSGAMSQWEGQISLYHPAGGGPCYACVFPEAPAAGLVPSCAESGIVGALPGVVGSMMALEAIKWITRAGRSLVGRMLIYDALDSDIRTVNLSRCLSCGICGQGRNKVESRLPRPGRHISK